MVLAHHESQACIMSHELYHAISISVARNVIHTAQAVDKAGTHTWISHPMLYPFKNHLHAALIALCLHIQIVAQWCAQIAKVIKFVFIRNYLQNPSLMGFLCLLICLNSAGLSHLFRCWTHTSVLHQCKKKDTPHNTHIYNAWCGAQH